MIVDGLLPMGLPSPSFVAGSLEIVARRRIHSLPELSNPVDDLLTLFIVNRYLERLLARGRPEKGDCQIAACACLRFRFLRRFQNLDQLLSLCGRLET